MKIWKWGHGGGQGIHYSTQPTGSELKELVAQWAKLLFMRWPWKARELSLHSQLAALVRKGFVYLNKEKASISLFLPSNPITTSSSLLTSMFRVASAFFIPFLCATIRSPFKPSSGLLVIISHRADSTSHLKKGTQVQSALFFYVLYAFCLPSISTISLVGFTDLGVKFPLCLLRKRFYKKLMKFKVESPSYAYSLWKLCMGSNNFVNIVYIYNIYSF